MKKTRKKKLVMPSMAELVLQEQQSVLPVVKGSIDFYYSSETDMWEWVIDPLGSLPLHRSAIGIEKTLTEAFFMASKWYEKRGTKSLPKSERAALIKAFNEAHRAGFERVKAMKETKLTKRKKS